MDVFVNHSVSLTKKLETLVEENADVFHYVSRSSLDIIYGKFLKFLKVYKIYILPYEFLIFLLQPLLKDAMLDTQLNLLTNENCFLAESIDW